MKYTFKGNLCGYLCEDCTEPLYGMEVLLYLPWKREAIAENTAANTKETFHIVSKEEANQRKDLLLDRVFTDENGGFEFSIDEKYSNTAFDIDFYCGNVPKGPKKEALREPLQIHLTTVLPEFDEQNNFVYNWRHCIAYKWWCYIRGHYFDAWVICGHLRNCDTGKPISGATVTAWDADFLTDDNLGNAITDASGHFRIDYNSLTFKKTFLSPWINVETDPGALLTFQSGPDVYFKAELSGVTLIDETSADCRKNVGYCLCVNLCSKVNVIDGGETTFPFPSAWTGIGSAFSASFGPHSYDFDVDGYAGSGKYALSGVIGLTGQAALKSAVGNRIEYRFRVSDVTTANGTPSPGIANFTKTVGVTPNLFASSVVSKLTKKIPTGVSDDLYVFSDLSDFDVNGWFDVNNAIERTLLNEGLLISDLNLYNIIEEDTLISMNTAALTSAPNVPNSLPGVAIAAANKIPIEKFAIRFEIREVVNKPANIFNVVPGSGKTLNSVIMNNNPVFMKLSIAELEATGLCNPISGTVHAKYTVYHPHLASSSLHLNNNSFSVDRDVIGDGFLTLPSNTNPLIDGNANLSLNLNNPPNDMTRCTYALRLYARARLHDGVNPWSDSGPVTQLFFYEV
jgi:hypothetical protein